MNIQKISHQPSWYTVLMNTHEAMIVSGYAKSTICRLCETGQVQAKKVKGDWEIDPVSLAAYKPIPPPGNLPRPKGKLAPISTIIVRENEAQAWALEGNLARNILIFKLHKHVVVTRNRLEVFIEGLVTEEFLNYVQKAIESYSKQSSSF